MSRERKVLLFGGLGVAAAGLCGFACLAALLLVVLPAGRDQDGPAFEPQLEAAPSGSSGNADVVVNGQAVSQATLDGLAQQAGLEIGAGVYWYDRYSGAWGYAGGPTAGFIVAGLELGGPLPAAASGGETGVFVNGRELPFQEAAGLQQLFGTLYQGRYWLDAYGNFGYEGGPALGNLVYMLQTAGQSGGGSGYFESTYGGYIGSDGDSSYFFDPQTGCSVISGGGVSC